MKNKKEEKIEEKIELSFEKQCSCGFAFGQPKNYDTWVTGANDTGYYCPKCGKRWVMYPDGWKEV